MATVSTTAHRLDDLQASVDDIKTKVQDHDHFIHGNGQPGAKVRFNSIELKLNLILWICSLLGTVLAGCALYLATDLMPKLYSALSVIK
jgi:hypothetical protein